MRDEASEIKTGDSEKAVVSPERRVGAPEVESGTYTRGT